MPVVPVMANVTLSHREDTKDRWVKSRWNPRLSPQSGHQVHADGQPEVEPADAVVPKDHHGEHHRDQREGHQGGSH
jgi:hypothetical protein